MRPLPMNAFLLLLVVLAQTFALQAAATTLPDPSRGALLYENHCQGCHESTLHVRTDPRATSPIEVRDWVRYWADRNEFDWSNEDVSDVADFLVRRYYRFPLPAS